MAQPSGTFAVNDMVGVREDLTDVIYSISPIDTPFLSMAAQTEATNVTHEWQIMELTAAATNYVIEGDDATTDAGVATVRRSNQTNISDKVARVTGTARSVKAAGRGDEMDYQMLIKGKELKRDIETVLLANQAKVTGDDTTARKTAGVSSWIATNADKASDGSNPTGDGSDARTNGTQRAFTEDQVKTVLQLIAEQGGNPSVLMTGTFNRQIASTFVAGKTVMQKAEDDKLHATFSVYESDFGQLKLVFNRFQPSRTAFILDMDMWAVAFLKGRNMLTTPLAKTGDTDRSQILAEYALEARNQKASGVIADLTTS